jgi:octaprenyl-diphosphate synthase
MTGKSNEATYRAASLIELLHTASLVHDDVVDDSNERRGFFSINALWKNKIAVLVGDYMLSRGLLLSVDNQDFELLRIVSDATREMSEGELLQIEKTRKLDIEESVYFDIIQKKTASLIASCCASGAKSVDAPEEVVKQMHQFGTYAGIAFQIKDDLLDYKSSAITGKPNGADIKEKKMTLPLIYTLQQLNGIERKNMIRAISKKRQNPKKIADIIKKVADTGGIRYAEEKMMEYRQKAIEMLEPFPGSEYKSSLKDLVVYITERQH